MKEITIDCPGIRSRKNLHDYLESVLSLPEYYERNLDSLARILLTVNGGNCLSVCLLNRASVSGRMKEQYAALYETLTHVHEENPNVSVREEQTVPQGRKIQNTKQSRRREDNGTD